MSTTANSTIVTFDRCVICGESGGSFEVTADYFNDFHSAEFGKPRRYVEYPHIYAAFHDTHLDCFNAKIAAADISPRVLTRRVFDEDQNRETVDLYFISDEKSDYERTLVEVIGDTRRVRKNSEGPVIFHQISDFELRYEITFGYLKDADEIVVSSDEIKTVFTVCADEHLTNKKNALIDAADTLDGDSIPDFDDDLEDFAYDYHLLCSMRNAVDSL